MIFIYIYIYIFKKDKDKDIHKDNPVRPSFSSPQILCVNMPVMDGHWRSLRIVNIRTNKVTTSTR